MSDGNAPFADPHAVVFDFCGVLYDDSGWRRWLLQLLHRVGLHTHYTLFFQVWEQEHLEDVFAGRKAYWDALRCLLRAAGVPSGSIDEVCAAGQARRRMWEETVRPLPGVRSTLQQLNARGVPLALLSHASFSKQLVLDKLSGLQLSDLFRPSLVFSSSEMSASSVTPYAQRFQYVAEQLHTEPCQTLYVGRCARPLETAAALGLPVRAFNADAPHPQTLERFSSILELVASQPRQRAG